MTANISTLAIHVDYQNAYDRVWHAALLSKLENTNTSYYFKNDNILTEIQEGVCCIQRKASDIFYINIGLHQGSSLNPYLFTVFHCDLVQYIGAHQGHLFADDLCVIIRPSPPIATKLASMIEYLNQEGTRVCNHIFI